MKIAKICKIIVFAPLKGRTLRNRIHIDGRFEFCNISAYAHATFIYLTFYLTAVKMFVILNPVYKTHCVLTKAQLNTFFYNCIHYIILII